MVREANGTGVEASVYNFFEPVEGSTEDEEDMFRVERETPRLPSVEIQYWRELGMKLRNATQIDIGFFQEPE